MWPFSRKDTSVTSRKSAGFLFGMGASRGTLSGAAFEKLASEGYTENGVVHACINRIANAISSVEPQLYQRKGGKIITIDSHPLLDLLSSPNPAQSGREFIRAQVSYYLLGGNAYVYGNGIDPSSRKPKAPTELQLLNPGKIKIEPGAGLFPESFEYKPNSNTTVVYPVDPITGMSQVMQFKTFNPLNQWYGLSPIMGAAYGIDIFNSGQKWNKRLLDNDARPSGALIAKDADGKPATFTDEQYQRLQEMISTTFSGADNAGRPLLLEGGLDWKEMSLNPKDMDFLQAKHSAARDIGLVFGVPSQMLGIPGDSTFANYEQAVQSFWTDTVLPLLGQLLEGYNRWLTPLYGPDLYLGYDEEMIPALEVRRKERFTRVSTAEFMTIDEKRRAVGMDNFPHKLGEALLLSGRGVLLGADGSIVALAINTSVDSVNDPLLDTYAAPQPGALTQPTPAKTRQWLIENGYTPERAERLAKLMYG